MNNGDLNITPEPLNSGDVCEVLLNVRDLALLTLDLEINDKVEINWEKCIITKISDRKIHYIVIDSKIEWEIDLYEFVNKAIILKNKEIEQTRKIISELVDWVFIETELDNQLIIDIDWLTTLYVLLMIHWISLPEDILDKLEEYFKDDSIIE